eukprot:CAMPEP_0202401946 /NCGR_PEP_ID=MMETSP1128-20130828/3860_1 /ASSEMBLY_ACC=CAM_ASM_000463 /TAXON_ID=3047 /ORGANISM="Dunaliella tertiolecta, Strain CCMP1320" /LENGTH=73 /DNA_ID=CAMNT_0049005863 /DNA_START=652 /DNA_END=873 /DNA_ORIENTATION=-
MSPTAQPKNLTPSSSGVSPLNDLALPLDSKSFKALSKSVLSSPAKSVPATSSPELRSSTTMTESVSPYVRTKL